MKTYKIKIKAEETYTLHAVGSRYHVVQADKEVAIETSAGATVKGVAAGMGLATRDKFERLTITSETTQVIDIAVGDDDVIDSRATIAGRVDSAGGGLSIVTTAKQITTSSAIILAQNANRRSITLQNTSLNPIVVGGAGVSVATGLIIASEGVITIDSAAGAEIHAVTAAGIAELRVMTESN